jgi:hypothetical protein
LRGDRSPLWAIEGGVRGTAAGEPSKPSRFVWLMGAFDFVGTLA